MTGVEILATQEVAVTFGVDFEIFFTIFAVAIFVMELFVGLGCYSDLGWRSFVLGAMTGAIFGSIFGGIAASKAKPLEYETQYKVTISDEVPINEFLERYEIIDQEGKIYTVRERE